MRHAIIAFLFLVALFQPVKAQGGIPFDREERERLASSVVQLLVITNGNDEQRGSGTLVSPDGLIFTNYHVVEDAAQIQVLMYEAMDEPPRLQYYARIVKSVEDLDLAVLEINADSRNRTISAQGLNLPHITEWTTDVDHMDEVYIFGYYNITSVLNISPGIITAIQSRDFRGKRYPYYLSDAEFADGGSGGLVVNRFGQFIGIPRAVTQAAVGEDLTEILPLATICKLEPDVCELNPSPSAQVVFIRGSDVFLYDTNSPDSSELLVSTGDNYEPDISGNLVAYASGRNDRLLDIFIYDLKSGREYQLTTDDGQDRHPSFSPEGQRIAFASNRSGNWDIYIIDTDGNNLTQVTSSPSFEYAPTWSPDGRYLAYQSDRDDGDEIYIQDLQTGSVRRLTNSSDDMVGALWSPNGDYITCYAYVNPPYALVLDAQTGNKMHQFAGTVDEWIDGNILLFHRVGSDGVPYVYTFDVSTGREGLFIRNGSWAAADN